MPKSIKDPIKPRRGEFPEGDDIESVRCDDSGMELSSTQNPIRSADRAVVRAYVAQLADEGFFQDVPEEQIDSLQEHLVMGIFCESMLYHLHRAISDQRSANSYARPEIQKLSNDINRLAKRATDLKQSFPGEYTNLCDVYAAFMADACASTDDKIFIQIKDHLSADGLLQTTSALSNTLKYWLKQHPLRGKGAPANLRDELLVQDLARLYESVPGKHAGVSAAPWGSIAGGPFIRFIVGCLSVIDPDRKAPLPSKSSIQRTLESYRKG